MMNYRFTDKFKKDFKKLLKRYRSLNDDIQEFCLALSGVNFEKNKKFAILHKVDELLIVKARLFCKAIKKGSLRIIFSYNLTNKAVIHIEIYFKGDKIMEDKQRIDEFIKTNL